MKMILLMEKCDIRIIVITITDMYDYINYNFVDENDIDNGINNRSTSNNTYNMLRYSISQIYEKRYQSNDIHSARYTFKYGLLNLHST